MAWGAAIHRGSGTRKATSVEHARCAQCRNPIRGRQPRVRLARAEMTFHADCWQSLHAAVQADYARRAREEGIAALLGPYQRTEMASWLPEAAIDEAVEALSGQLEAHLGRPPSVTLDVDASPGEGP